MLRLLLPLAAVLLAACATPADRLRHVEVAACADKEAAGCEAARAGFQRLSYDSLDADKLTVAAARALGDLNFEVERDDARHQAAGAYVDSAPVHDKQLDSLFRGTLKPYQPAVISARVEVLPLAGRDSGGEVRLRLFAAADSGGQPAPVDSVGPYQVFFRQLGQELGLPDVDTAVDDAGKKRERQRPRAISPSIGGL